DGRGSVSNRYDRVDGTSFPNSSGGANILDVTATKDRLGNWTYFTYDSLREKTAVTNALGKITLYAYAPGGVVASATDPIGNLTTNYFDNIGRLTNTVTAGVTNFQSFNGLGQVISKGDYVETDYLVY